MAQDHVAELRDLRFASEIEAQIHADAAYERVEMLASESIRNGATEEAARLLVHTFHRAVVALLQNRGARIEFKITRRELN
jgi:hypothetical protein